MQQGLALGPELGCRFFEVSAKHGVNVDRAFLAVIRELRDHERRPEILDEGGVDDEKEIKGVKRALWRAKSSRHDQNKYKREYNWVKGQLGVEKY